MGLGAMSIPTYWLKFLKQLTNIVNFGQWTIPKLIKPWGNDISREEENVEYNELVFYLGTIWLGKEDEECKRKRILK